MFGWFLRFRCVALNWLNCWLFAFDWFVLLICLLVLNYCLLFVILICFAITYFDFFCVFGLLLLLFNVTVFICFACGFAEMFWSLLVWLNTFVYYLRLFCDCVYFIYYWMFCLCLLILIVEVAELCALLCCLGCLLLLWCLLVFGVRCLGCFIVSYEIWFCVFMFWCLQCWVVFDWVWSLLLI